MDKSELLNGLLTNLLGISAHIQSAFVFDRDGLIIGSAVSGADKMSVEDVLGAIASIMDSLFKRIGKEYHLGKYISGAFETQDQRLVFAEAGKKSILISVVDFEVSMNQILPYVFLVAEKIQRITEDNIGEGFNVNVPNLSMEDLLSEENMVNLNQQTIEISDSDGSSNKIDIMSPMALTIRYKLIVLGDAAVGKTSIIDKFAHDKFNQDYLPTLGISITDQTYGMHGNPSSKIQFMIWDLAGQKFFQRARKAYLSGSRAAFIVFDLTNEASFHNIPSWFEEIRQEVPNIPCILIGNKSDIIDKRVISQESAQKLANELKCPYIETSALTGENIKEAFQLLGIGLFFLKSQEPEESMNQDRRDQLKMAMDILKEKLKNNML